MDEFQSDKRMSDQFKILRENTKVLEWWWKELREIENAYKGVSHALNLANADLVKQSQAAFREIQGLKDTCERLAIERDELNALVGQLQSDFAALSERFERLAEWANEQKRGKTKG